MDNKQSKTHQGTIRTLEDYPEILTVYELAEILRIDRSTAYQLLHEGNIRYRRIGTTYRISKNSVLKSLD